MFSNRLAGLLTQYGINNWRYHEDKNPLSILILDPKKFGINPPIYRSWVNDKELTIVGNVDKDSEAIVLDIRQFVRKNSRYVARSLSLLTKMESLKYDKDRKQYQESNGKSAIGVLKNHGFEVTDRWISWKKYIPIRVIIYKQYVYYGDPERLKNMGYGISEFKVVNDRTLKSGVYCIGEHPNVSRSGKLCGEEGTGYLRVNLENLMIVRGLLSHINLNTAYNPSIHVPKLKPLIEE